ncbi:MAG: cytochrome ubiquinol oxidase subunit I, partial [Pyrinomonadaceae bacterium]
NQGFSTTVSAGNGLFTLIGFMGMYFVLGILFLYLISREVERGPEALSPVPTAHLTEESA